MPATSEDATSDEKKKKTKIKEKKRKMIDPSIAALKNMRSAVRSALVDCEPGDEIKTLVQTLQHNVSAQQVKEDILTAFQHYYPGIFKDEQLQLFGSTVMGLSFKDSDLDFYVDLPQCEQYKCNKARTKIIRNILEPIKKFARFESITKPRVPIIKCTHIGTLTNCDFNCSSEFGSLNSPIIAHLLNFDPRIRKLAIIVKYWMKIHDCAGINRISNYAVVWLLIFYLQTLAQPIVLPIDEFQRNVPPSMVSHYNFAFDYAIPNRTENRTECPELLLGFFKFYRDFDYVSKLICPLYGKTFSKADVLAKRVTELQRNEQILSVDGNERPMLLDKRSLCIQDPFETLRRIPGDIAIRNFQRIVWKIGYAAEIIESELHEGAIKSLLLQMFDTDKFDQYVKQKESRQELERKLKAQQHKVKEQQRIAERKTAKENDLASSVNEHNNPIATGKSSEQQNVNALRIQYSPISTTSVLSHNAQLRKLILQLKPTTFILNSSVWRKHVPNSCSNLQSAEHSIRKMWAEEVIEMIVDVLSDIFCLDVYHNDSIGTLVKRFDLIGARDVFINRRQTKLFDSKTWNDEVLNSSKRFIKTAKDIPLDVSAKVHADTVNFDYVHIEFIDLIRTRKLNFYRMFCSHFIGALDYFLKIYFVRRNEMAKSATVNANSAAVSANPAAVNANPATEPSAQQKSTETTLPTTPTTLQNFESPTSTMHLKATEPTLFMIRDMLSKSVTGIDKAAVQQFWSETVIEFVIQILSDIFRLELSDSPTSDRFQKVFAVGGACDVFTGRKQQSPIDGNTLKLELQESVNRFAGITTPMALSVKLATDVSNFESVSIEFSDRIRTEDDNFYVQFDQQFRDNVHYLLDVYFVHRHQLMSNSHTLQCKFVKYEPSSSENQ